jgi:hypothetical protein
MLSPKDCTPFQTGAALDVKPRARTLGTPLAVWAALPRDAKVQRGCDNQDRTQQCPVPLTRIPIILTREVMKKILLQHTTPSRSTEKVKPINKTHFDFHTQPKQNFLTLDRCPGAQATRTKSRPRPLPPAGQPLHFPGLHNGCLAASTLTIIRSAQKKTRRALSPSSPPYKTSQSPVDSLRARSFRKQPFRIEQP